MTIVLGLLGGFVFWGLAILSCFERDGLIFKKDEHGTYIYKPKDPHVIAIIAIVGMIICGAIGFHIDSQFPSHSSSSSYSSSSRDENGLKKKECPVCHNEFTDADNKKSLRLYSMCKQCKKNYDTAQQMLGN